MKFHIIHYYLISKYINIIGSCKPYSPSDDEIESSILEIFHTCLWASNSSLVIKFLNNVNSVKMCKRLIKNVKIFKKCKKEI